MLDAIELVGQVGMFRLVAVDRGKPGVAQLLAARADALVKVLVNAVGHEKLGVLGPAVGTLGRA